MNDSQYQAESDAERAGTILWDRIVNGVGYLVVGGLAVPGVVLTVPGSNMRLRDVLAGLFFL